MLILGVIIYLGSLIKSFYDTIYELFVIFCSIQARPGWVMAMNYVGNISILDRGDAPAQAVIDRNARSLAQRVADETKDELHKVLNRVDHVSLHTLGSQIEFYDCTT